MALIAEDGVIALLVAKIATGVTYIAAAISALVGFVTSLDLVALSGVCLGVATYLTNVYFKSRHDRREEELKNARIAALDRRMAMDIPVDQEIRTQEEISQYSSEHEPETQK